MSYDSIHGTVYLLHFERNYYHARHYCGFTTNLDARLTLHLLGQGARLTRAIQKVGINFILARIWQNGTPELEQQLKGSHDLSRHCPICQQERLFSLIYITPYDERAEQEGE